MTRAVCDARWLKWTLSGLLAAAVAGGLTLARPGAAQQQERPAAKADADNKEGQAKRTRRLPQYYAKVVDRNQRESIYKIQETYQPQIDALEEQLKALIAKRDGEIE